MQFFVWESHTCFVCSGGTGIPTYHASSKAAILGINGDEVVHTLLPAMYATS